AETPRRAWRTEVLKRIEDVQAENAEASRENEELRGLVGEASCLVEKFRNLPAGHAGHAAKALRAERSALARRVQLSAVRSRHPRNPLPAVPLPRRQQPRPSSSSEPDSFAERVAANSAAREYVPQLLATTAAAAATAIWQSSREASAGSVSALLLSSARILAQQATSSTSRDSGPPGLSEAVEEQVAEPPTALPAKSRLPLPLPLKGLGPWLEEQQTLRSYTAEPAPEPAPENSSDDDSSPPNSSPEGSLATSAIEQQPQQMTPTCRRPLAAADSEAEAVEEAEDEAAAPMAAQEVWAAPSAAAEAPEEAAVAEAADEATAAAAAAAVKACEEAAAAKVAEETATAAAAETALAKAAEEAATAKAAAATAAEEAATAKAAEEAAAATAAEEAATAKAAEAQAAAALSLSRAAAALFTFHATPAAKAAEEAAADEAAEGSEEAAVAARSAEEPVAPFDGTEEAVASNVWEFRPVAADKSDSHQRLSISLPRSDLAGKGCFANSLGLSLKQSREGSRQGLSVVEVLDGGAIAFHNSKQLALGQVEKLVLPGMRVEGVNGFEGEMALLLKVLSEGEVSELIFAVPGGCVASQACGAAEGALAAACILSSSGLGLAFKRSFDSQCGSFPSFHGAVAQYNAAQLLQGIPSAEMSSSSSSSGWAGKKALNAVFAALRHVSKAARATCWTPQDAVAEWDQGQASDEDDHGQSLALPGRLLGEALTQDDQHLCLQESCAAGTGSADYELRELAGDGLPPADIQRMWRSFDSLLVLWKYGDPRAPEVTEYHGVTQQIVAVATAAPKSFVSGVSHFLVISTPVEVSLHALRFAPGSDHLLPPVRTQHAVATDDVVVGAIATDPNSGRIFLGGSDGCIHEFQYFDAETRWLGKPKRCRKSLVNWNLQSRLPSFLQRVSEAVFGPAEAITQLVIDSSRGLLFSLSSLSTVTVFQLPAGRTDSSGGMDEPPLVQICSITQSSIAAEVARIRSRLFPGLQPASRGMNPFGGVTATGLKAHPQIVKLLAMGKAEGGSVVACAVAEDGTRVYLQGRFRAPTSFTGSGAAQFSGDQGSASAQGTGRGSPTMIALGVHHVRFLDAVAPQNLHVRDAILADGIMMLLCRIPSTSSQPPTGDDAVLALSPDLRALAQRQGRGRSPWLTAAGAMTEHIDVIRLAGSEGEGGGGRVIGLAPLASPSLRPIQLLYASSPGKDLVLPVLGLSELAKQQLLPPPRFMLVSTLGAHVLQKIRPLDILQERLLSGDLPLLKDFALQYTAEQTCALCFQLLMQAVPNKPSDFGLPGRAGGSSLSLQQGTSATSALLPAPSQDPNEQMLMSRAEQLLLSPQLAMQLGFSQAWPSVEPRNGNVGPGGQQGPGGPWGNAGSALGQSMQLQRLYLYLSRLMRPLWLAPIMLVTWPPAAAGSDNSKKRRRDEWWPPPPEPAPVARGANWRCSFSKTQRAHVRSELVTMAALIDRCLPRLTSEALGSAAQEEAAAATGSLQLVTTSLEVLGFLDLLAGRVDVLSAAPCPAEILVRFSELTFRDLVCQPEARRVLQQLMQGGVVQCRQLHTRCPTLFSAADLEVQEAYELLAMVRNSLSASAAGSSTLDLARLSHLTGRALRTLEQHASRVDLTEASSRLRAVGACKGLIALCSSIARARDPRDEALRPQDPAGPRIQQLHYARLECYQIVLEIFEDLLAHARKLGTMQGASPQLPTVGSPPTELPELLPAHVKEADAMPILDALLRHCLEAQQYMADELFHFCVLKWMMQRRLPPYRYDSPYLKNFLETHARDQPELLCRYFQHRGRWAEASDAFVSLLVHPAIVMCYFLKTWCFYSVLLCVRVLEHGCWCIKVSLARGTSRTGDVRSLVFV
ncbi:unnamed protein product, partial [Polarella glacialis]